MIKEGDRTRARLIGNAKAKEFYRKNGITTCELGYEDCWVNDNLSNAHDRKSKNLSLEDLSEPDMDRQILVCVPCHMILEHEMSAEEMGNIIRKTALDRNERLLNNPENENPKPMKKPEKKEKPKVQKSRICKNCGWRVGFVDICGHCGALFK